nr:cofactor assembly of complex C subunit B [cf. Phormidesmis sp. LEGE 11477]
MLLTGLMVIGLVFFIRASTKDRIEVAQFGSTQPPEPLQQAVMDYFQGRAYRQIEPTPAEASKKQPVVAALTDDSAVTVAGLVSPSWFLAVFLSALAAVGFACLALIVVTLFPGWGRVMFVLVAASPLAGVFYWRKSSRPEKVVFRVETAEAEDFASKLTVRGHRDELAELKNALASTLKAW